MLLFPAFLVPFALRWYWGRFNGAGFTAGIGAGFAAALAKFLLTPAGWNEAQRFLVVAGCSLAAALLASVVTPPVATEALWSFYQQVAPAGWWPQSWRRAHRREHRRDFARLGVALPWQILTFLLPMGLILRMWDAVVPAAIVWLALFCFLIRDLRLADATAPSTRVINAEAPVSTIPHD